MEQMTQISLNWTPQNNKSTTQKKDTMEFKKQLITPSLAKQLLEANINNRRVKQPVVLRYAQDMIAGRWKENTGETIKISKTGRLLDGQQRLMAIIKSNVPINFHVIYNLEEDVFDVLDTGSVRNATDVFHIEGIKNDNVIPSIITTYYVLSKGIIKQINGKSVSKQYRPTNHLLKEMYYQRENFWQSVGNQTASWYQSFAKILPPSTIGGFYSFFYDINHEDAFQFMHQLCTGQDIKNKTIALLRTKLMQDKMDSKKISASLKQAYIIKTWNLFRKNEEAKMIKFNTAIEEYPVAI
jgi:hypothetical protein